MVKAGAALSPVEMLLFLEEAGARIETVGRLHRMLAQAGSGIVFELGPYLQEVGDATLLSMSTAGNIVLDSALTEACAIHDDQVLPVGMIVGEVLTNSIKSCASERGRGPAVVRSGVRPNGTILIEIADDGVGLPEGFDPESDGDLGLRLVHSLAHQLGAKLSWESTSLGLTVSLALPATELWGT